MAKFRTNHGKKRASESGGMIVRMLLFATIIGVFIFFLKKSADPQKSVDPVIVSDVENLKSHGLDSIFYLPATFRGELIRHKYFALSYHEENELAEWVAYELTADRLQTPSVKYTPDFRPDTLVATGSADSLDYRDTKYDCGLLVAAADMAFASDAIAETYIMSNVAPQLPVFNQGVWRELEERTRQWAKAFKHLYVVSGPVFYGEVQEWIGPNKVAVPDAFYRVLLDLREPEKKAIAFIIPKNVTDKRLEQFATSIDSVEKTTGIDFFPNLMSKPLEEDLESHFDTNLWKTNEN